VRFAAAGRKGLVDESFRGGVVTAYLNLCSGFDFVDVDANDSARVELSSECFRAAPRSLDFIGDGIDDHGIGAGADGGNRAVHFFRTDGQDEEIGLHRLLIRYLGVRTELGSQLLSTVGPLGVAESDIVSATGKQSPDSERPVIRANDSNSHGVRVPILAESPLKTSNPTLPQS
jgi:hypothetical protein